MGRKEFHENVILKNDYIKNSFVLYHYYTPDLSEVLFINIYDSWDDIEKATDKSDELAEAYWTDEDERTDFFRRQSSFYTMEHSDEIYSLSDNAKMLESIPDTAKLFYLRKRRAKRPPMNGTGEQVSAIRKMYADSVLQKNEHPLAFYPMRHLYGADSRDIVEIFVIDDIPSLDMMEAKNQELASGVWSEEEMSEAGALLDLYIERWHGDYIYSSEAALMK